MTNQHVPTVAAFDFDGTLTRRDSVLPFLISVFGPRSVALAFARSLPPAGSPSLPNRDLIKQRLSSALFTGMDAAYLEAAGKEYASKILEKGLHPERVASLNRHRQAGDLVVVVSASFSFYLRPAAEALGATAAICTELEIDASGRCTGQLLGGNCRGAEKVRRLEAWAARQEVDLAKSPLYAYGDSTGDRELLGLADHPIWVGRRAQRLARSFSKKAL